MRDLGKWICPVPWQHMEVCHDNTVKLCCHIDRPTGDLTKQSPEEAWNGPASREVRRSILAGEYAYCNHTTCPVLGQPVTPDWRLTMAARDFVPSSALAPRPARVSISNDRSCNLACESCRAERYVGPAPRTSVEAWRSLEDFVRTAEILKLNGAGELLMNAELMEWLRAKGRDYPHLKFEILTNATLTTPGDLRRLDVLESTKMIYVSVDAATAETYKIVRGGNFRTVLRNLEAFAEYKRKRAPHIELVLGHVTSVRNFREVDLFADLAKRLGAAANFTRLQQWGHLRHFAELDVAHKDHPLHEKLVEMLSLPELGEPHVRLNDLAFARRTP